PPPPTRRTGHYKTLTAIATGAPLPSPQPSPDQGNVTSPTDFKGTQAQRAEEKEVVKEGDERKSNLHKKTNSGTQYYNGKDQKRRGDNNDDEAEEEERLHAEEEEEEERLHAEEEEERLHAEEEEEEEEEEDHHHHNSLSQTQSEVMSSTEWNGLLCRDSSEEPTSSIRQGLTRNKLDESSLHILNGNAHFNANGGNHNNNNNNLQSVAGRYVKRSESSRIVTASQDDMSSTHKHHHHNHNHHHHQTSDSNNNNNKSNSDSMKWRSDSLANDNLPSVHHKKDDSTGGGNTSGYSSARGSKETRVWTLPDLVMDVTSPVSHDMQKTLSALILCHKAFTDSVFSIYIYIYMYIYYIYIFFLLALEGTRSLMKQLRVQFREGDKLKQFQLEEGNEQGKQSKDWMVRVRVCNAVSFWIKHYWEEDFLSQRELQQQVHEFKQDILQICEPQKGHTLVEKLDMSVQGANHGRSSVHDSQATSTDLVANDTISEYIYIKLNLVSSDSRASSKINLTPTEEEQMELEEAYREDQVHIRWPHIEKCTMSIPEGMELMLLDPDDIAQQLTLMDFHILKQIKARECIGQSWKKRGKEKWRLAPNVLRMIAQFNSVSKWIQLIVLGGKTPKERANWIKKILTMMKSLQKNRNFSSFCACHAALNSADIKKLKQTWHKLPRTNRKEWEDINEFFDWRMTKLKQLQEQSAAPAVPHIGLYLQVLFNIDEGKKDTTAETGGVNYVKMMMLHDQIERLTQYQQGKYEITEMLQIQRLLYQDFATQYKMSEKHINQLADIVRNTEREK
ncbi:hypothetical protein RFI_12774, partial [Reticulomyxa filosa]